MANATTSVITTERKGITGESLPPTDRRQTGGRERERDCHAGGEARQARAFGAGPSRSRYLSGVSSPTEQRTHPGPETVGLAAALTSVPEGAPHVSLRALVQTLRPHQWVKNLFVLAPMFFHKDVFKQTPEGSFLNLTVTGHALAATGVFCLLAGAVYTINDLVDVDADRIHPIKRERPIASGRVSASAAHVMAAGLVTFSLGLAYALSSWMAVIAVVYFLENLAYSFRLKNVAFLDVGLIAFGFVLRVFVGGIAEDVHVSGYLLACTTLLALYLGFGKRRQELALQNAGKQRASLGAYSARSLNVALFVTGTTTGATWIAYTLDPVTRAYFNSNYLWLTVPFVLFGIWRFKQLVSGKVGRGLKAESPTQEMLRDVPFVLNLVLWVAVVVAIVYKLRPN
jgi:decaprenyl-phosphate phosphoribosyltransferase